MKKSIIAAGLVLTMAGLLAGCGKKDPAYLSGITAADYVELPDYSSIPIEEAAPSVSDAYVDTYIQYQLTANTQKVEITSRDDVQDGDIANIDYTGKIDGEEFSGGSATGYDLTIGSGSFIDGFEDGLIGAKVGETVTLNLKFPDDYSNEDVAGKDVQFDVTVNKIQENQTPELDDTFVQSQNIDGVSTVDEYRQYCYDYLMEQAQSTYDSDIQNKIVSWLEDNTTFKQDPPTEMVDRWNTTYTDNITATAEAYGLDLATYMSYMGSSEDTYEDDIKEYATSAAKLYIIMQAIADQEDISISKSQLKTALSNAAASAGYSSLDDYRKEVDVKAYKEYMMEQKVLELLTANVVVSEPSDEETDTEETAAEDTTSEETAAEDTTAEDAAESASAEDADAATSASSEETADAESSATESSESASSEESSASQSSTEEKATDAASAE